VIVLIRHAEARWSTSANEVVSDPGLTDNGRIQSSRLADALIDERVDVLISSPMQRAAATFALAAGREPAESDIKNWLREINYPDWRGFPLNVVQGILEEHDRADIEARWAGLVGGEPVRKYVELVRNGAEAFLSQYGMTRSRNHAGLWEFEETPKRIAMIGHIGSLASIMSMLLGLPAVSWERQRFLVPNASITRLVPVHVGPRFAFCLRALGDDSHLPADLRTW
jgi:broad specificity phosphatase PhoE